jgi:chromosome segregation ATPase
MESLMPASDLPVHSIASHLRETNARLTQLLDSLSAIPNQSRTITPQQMTGLLSELMRAGEWLRRLPEDRDPELQQEVGHYRRTVERLRDLLPSIHAALLRDRARLEQERARVQSAAAWARSSRQTL